MRELWDPILDKQFEMNIVMLTRFSPLLSEDERTEQISLLNSSKKSEKV